MISPVTLVLRFIRSGTYSRTVARENARNLRDCICNTEYLVRLLRPG